jgi:hypothetical protein
MAELFRLRNDRGTRLADVVGVAGQFLDILGPAAVLLMNGDARRPERVIRDRAEAGAL